MKYFKRFIIKNRIIILFILVAIFLSGFFFLHAFARDNSKSAYYKYYTSIEIKAGDTLWSIAYQYANEKYISVEDYIEELKYMNCLSSDQIIEGCYLTISYYSEEYK